MEQVFDKYGQYIIPTFILCNPDRSELYALGSIANRQYKPRFNSLSEISFTAFETIDGISMPYYDLLVYRRKVYLPEIGYFTIASAPETGDGLNKKKEVTAYSDEVEFANKKISVFRGTYKFYDLIQPAGTLLRKLLDYLPGWTVGTVDTELTLLYRTFNITDKTIYDFMMHDVEETYECVFLFDDINKTVSARTLSRASTDTDIYVSYDNVIQNIDINESTEELVTALTVLGGGDLSINQVNPLGTDIIYDFSYFKDIQWMSQDLIDAITAWEGVFDANQPVYAEKMTLLQDENTILLSQRSELAILQAEYDSLDGVRRVKIQQGLSLTTVNAQLNAKQAEIEAKNAQISATNDTIGIITSQLQTINTAVSFAVNFTASQLEQLSGFVLSSSYINENFIQTDLMTVVEIQEQAQALYDQALGVLARISEPRYTFSMDSVNFVFIEDFQPYIDQLVMGAVFHMEIKEGVVTRPILLGLDLNYDNPTDFKLLFGNRLRLDDGAFQYSDLIGAAISSSTTTKVNSELWNSWSDNYKDPVSEFITSSLNAALNNVTSGSSQEILINQNGIRGRTLGTTSMYDPSQIWIVNNMIAFTDDNWESASLALGQITNENGTFFGVVGDTLVGRVVAANQLTITNENNKFLVDGNGATLIDASLTITSENNAQIIIDADSGISISKRTLTGWQKNFYVDANGNLIFSGNLSGASGTFTGSITAASGKIGSWSINEYGLYDIYGNYIYGDGRVRLGALSINGSTAIFNGNIYANNLLGYVQGEQLRNVNADYINAGTIRGIDIYGTRIYWDQTRMYESATGVATIATDDYMSLEAGTGVNLGAIYLSPAKTTIYNEREIIIGSGNSGGKISFKGNLYTGNKQGKSGTYVIGANNIEFTNGLMTNSTFATGDIRNSTWTLPEPTAASVSGIQYIFTASDSFTFGKVGRINSLARVSLADKTVIATSNCLVMCASPSIAPGQSGNWLLYGIVTNSDRIWTTGGLVYLGTAGELTQIVPTGSDVVAQVIGVAIAYNKIFFNPSLVQVELL